MRIYLGLIILLMALAACSTPHKVQPLSIQRNHVLTGEYEHVATSDTPLKIIFKKAAEYPAEFQKNRIEGRAKIFFVVDTEGVPVQVQYTEATDLAFAREAIKAVSQWRFEPALKDGVAVPACVTVPIVFDP